MVDDAIAFLREGSCPPPRNAHQGSLPVRFDRRELDRILGLYGRMVAAGEWRDYAIDFLEDCAVFSIYRRASEMPLYRIEKRPKLKSRQGQYAAIAMAGQILKRGHELASVLRVFDRKLIKALEKAD
jgi:Protein of unknown function (DUF2794)